MTTQEVLDQLGRVHPMNSWVSYRECWRIDLFALGCNNSTGFRRVAYEVKVSMSDLRAELRRPEKRAEALALSHQFYFAMPEPLAQQAELMIPEECGLVAIRDGRDPVWVPRSITKGAATTPRVRLVKRAPIREPRAFGPHEIAYLVRFPIYREKLDELKREVMLLRRQVDTFV